MCSGSSDSTFPVILWEPDGNLVPTLWVQDVIRRVSVTVMWSLCDQSTPPVITAPPHCFQTVLLSGSSARRCQPTGDKEWEGEESNGGGKRNEMKGMDENEKKSEWLKGNQSPCV